MNEPANDAALRQPIPQEQPIRDDANREGEAGPAALQDQYCIFPAGHQHFCLSMLEVGAVVERPRQAETSGWYWGQG